MEFADSLVVAGISLMTDGLVQDQSLSFAKPSVIIPDQAREASKVDDIFKKAACVLACWAVFKDM